MTKVKAKINNRRDKNRLFAWGSTTFSYSVAVEFSGEGQRSRYWRLSGNIGLIFSPSGLVVCLYFSERARIERFRNLLQSKVLHKHTVISFGFGVFILILPDTAGNFLCCVLFFCFQIGFAR